MSVMNKPQFELTRVFSDGSQEVPEVVPLGDALQSRTGRRGALGAGLAATAVLALFDRAGAQSPSGFRATTLGGGGRSHRGGVTSVAFSPDGKILVSASEDKTGKLWSLPEGALLKSGRIGEGGILVAISPDGSVLASGGRGEYVVRLWSLPEGELLKTLEGHRDYLNAVAVSPDGKVLASGSRDKTVKLWSLPGGQLLETLPERGGWVNSVAISPDGKVLATGNFGTVKLWSLPGGELVKTLEGHGNAVESVAITADGKMLVSGSWDKTVKLWSLSDGELLKTLEGHDDRVVSVAVSPDGKMVVSGSWDKTVKLWSLSDGALRKTLEGHDDRVVSVAVSPDGKTLASGSWDKTVRLWSLPEGELLTQFVDLEATPDTEKGATLEVRNESGQSVTYTLPCGTPIPPGAVCTCNCVPGAYRLPVYRPPAPVYRPPSPVYTPPAPARPPAPRGGPISGSGGSYCTCNKICTCIPVSDRHAKENLEEIDESEILAGVSRIQVRSWNYKGESEDVRHIGPMAQDFAAAFGVGDSDRHIHMVDAMGVALASIRELHRLALAQQQEIAELRRMLAGFDRDEEERTRQAKRPNRPRLRLKNPPSGVQA